jgi:protein ImuB
VQADGQPCHHGPLRLLTGPRRIEVGWWPDAAEAASKPAARDYFIAQTAAAELLWIYRERATAAQPSDAAPRWFLQGLYA